MVLYCMVLLKSQILSATNTGISPPHLAGSGQFLIRVAANSFFGRRRRNSATVARHLKRAIERHVVFSLGGRISREHARRVERA
jgi:hypothetical protein